MEHVLEIDNFIKLSKYASKLKKIYKVQQNEL